MSGGLREPKDKSIGGDLAGRVESVGATVKQFRPGDEVFGVRRGAFAEYACARENYLALKPANVSFEEKSSSLLQRQVRRAFSGLRIIPASKANVWL
jgi:NADPH:quinone reductase-like Zn-dependent oxidoreductase